MRHGLLAFLTAVCLTVPLGVIGAAEETTPQRGKEVQAGPKPDWSWLPQLRFLTEPDYPPFNYYDEDARLAGLNVDLARAICRELSIPCEINTGEWSTLIPALKSNEADAVIASLAITRRSLAEVDFTSKYYTTPARFVGRVETPLTEVSASTLNGFKVGVVKGSSHEAFLRDFFSAVAIVSFSSPGEARVALKNKAVDLVFGDGISLMFWVLGSESGRCCEFKGEGYTESKYFGDGVGIAVRKGDNRLRDVLNYALNRIKASGRYEELMLRYFPLPLY